LRTSHKKSQDLFFKKILKIHPGFLVVLSFAITIIVGAFLLMLPLSTQPGHISFIDALFTATSATCVTGLIVVDTGSYFTAFGQTVILLLIQIGGLGVMTISVALFHLIGKSISFRQRMVMQDIFSPTPRGDILRLIRSIMMFTLAAELTGAVFLFCCWYPQFSWHRAVYLAVFHSISAFCNAGFSLFPDSLSAWSDNGLLNLTVCLLIVTGGLGFPVLYDIASRITIGRKVRYRLSVQTKSVILTSTILIVVGAVLFAFLERNGAMTQGSIMHRLYISVFQSITCRTAGFNTVDIGALNNATLTLMLFLMFFGASPGSCGGGVKTTTLAVVAAFTKSRLLREKKVNLFKKTIPDETVAQSTSLILTALGIIGFCVFMLLAANPGNGKGTFLSCLFETVSAFGTVGLSAGFTQIMDTWAKAWIILMMIIGRVGVLTFAYIIVGDGAVRGVEYAKENIMIG